VAAHEAGKTIEILGGLGWVEVSAPQWLNVYTYRVTPEPQALEFKVTMNGKPVDPSDFSAESWANLRK